jgi:hypothetical protein
MTLNDSIKNKPLPPTKRTARPRPTTDDFPSVAVLHDSQLNGVNANKLGSSFGLNVIKIKTPTCEAIPSSTEKLGTGTSRHGPIEAVVVHCGINDIKVKDARQASNVFVQNIKELKRSVPNAKIVVSRIPPVKFHQDPSLQANRDLFNAFVFADLKDEASVTFLSHENLFPSSMKDAIHPNQKGTEFLAQKIGRHLEYLLWERQRSQKKSFMAAGQSQSWLPGSRRAGPHHHTGFRRRTPTESRGQQRFSDRSSWKFSRRAYLSPWDY